MSSSGSSDTPETSAGIGDRDRETRYVGADGSNNHDSDSPASPPSSSSSSSSSRRRRGNDDNGEDGVMVSKENSVGGGDSDEVVVSEDAGREDMFLDAPEELGADGRESSGAYTEPRGDGSDTEQQISYRGLDNGMQNDYMVDEMERLRAMLDKTTNEKDSIARESKDQVEMVSQAIVNLRDQVRKLVDNPRLANDDSGGAEKHYLQQETTDSEQRDTAYLHQMIYECSVLLKNISESRSLAEGKIKQLEADSNLKDQEILELIVSRDVADSYVSSVQTASVESQFQKDLYVDDFTNRVLTSLASVVYVGELPDSSLPGKIAHVERNVFSLLENYNWFLYETDQLRQQLIEVRPDLMEQNDYGIVFAATRGELLGIKSKQVEYSEKLSRADNEYSKLMEQLERLKAESDIANTELGKVRAELEQEKNRYMNTKEKLSLAVTKGKALVQQRDSLKQNLADKTSELQKCLASLHENSIALEAAELLKEELLKSQISCASWQDMLSQKEEVLEMFENIMSEVDIPEGLRSMDIAKRVEWVVEDRNVLKDVSHKFHFLEDALLSIDLPENISFSDLESRLGWLREAFNNAKAEINALQDEINATKEASQSEVDQLTLSLSTVQAEKDHLRTELDDVMLKYAMSAEKEHQMSSEKEQLVKMLLDASGIAMGNEEDGYEHPSDTTVLAERCLGRLKEQSDSSPQLSQYVSETFANLQILFYIKDQELALCNLFLEEEMVDKSEFSRLLDNFREASREAALLKDEKDSLTKDLERSEDKSSMIREKLSMAVKKGKGLVQDRENLRQRIEEQSTEIEKLKLQLQQQESTMSDHVDQMDRLSAEVKMIPKFEADLAVLKDQKEQFENDLIESNNILQSVMKLVDRTSLPLGSDLDSPLSKVEKLIGLLDDIQASKATLEKQLEREKMEAESSSCKLLDVESTINSLNDALSVAESNLAQLAEEKRSIEADKASLEEQLQRALEESNSRYGMLAEAVSARDSLEAALSSAETNLVALRGEKEGVETGKAALEEELAKLKAEVSILMGRLKESAETINSLQDTSYQLEKSVALLTEEKNEAEHGRESAVSQLLMLNEDATSRDLKLQEAFVTVESLKVALEASGTNLSKLENEKKSAESEILELNMKLRECMEQLSGSQSSNQSRLLEIFDHLNDVAHFVNDEPIISFLKQSTHRRFEALKEMDQLFDNIRNQLDEVDKEDSSPKEVTSTMTKLLAGTVDKIVNIKTGVVNVDAAEAGDVSLYIKNLAENCKARHESLAEKMEGFFSFEDQYNSAVLEELRATVDKMSSTIEQAISLKQRVRTLETDQESLVNEMASLRNSISVLESACTNAAQLMHDEVDYHLNEFELPVDQQAANGDDVHNNRYGEIASELLSTSTKVCHVVKQCQISRSELSSMVETLKDDLNDTKARATKAVEELKSELIETKAREESVVEELKSKLIETKASKEKVINECNLKDSKIDELGTDLEALQNSYSELQDCLSEAKVTAENYIEESNLNKNKVSQLETNLAELDNLHHQLSLKLEKFEDIEASLRKREAEITSLATNLSTKEQEASAAFLWISQAKELLDMVDEIEHASIEAQGAQGGDLELHRYMNKLQSMINRLSDLHYQNGLLSREKEELQSALVSQGEEIEHSKMLGGKDDRDNQELEKVKGELFDLVTSVETLIRKLRGRDSLGDQKSYSTNEVIAILEKLVMGVISESDNAKARAHDLSSKLVGSQKVVEELLSKVKVLEESLQAKAAPSETIIERSIFEAPSAPSASEISEIEEVAPIAKPPIPSAVSRTMRKGSSGDHIAVDIASERLITKEEGLQEDKVHDFKSLNASGLIPVKGKIVADRVDGLWVSTDRLLMSRPRARLSVIMYWLVLHLWLLGTIL